jgi:hypothetical protein
LVHLPFLFWVSLREKLFKSLQILQICVEDSCTLFVAFVGAGADCVGVWEGAAAEGLFGDVGDDGD